jgi:peptide/nickel transport system permease protein
MTAVADRGEHSRGLRAFLRLPGAAVGVSLLALMIVLIVLGPLFAPYSPEETGLAPAGEPPSREHWLGVDLLGRDVASRVLWGGQSVLVIPVISVALAFAIGASLGLVAGYVGGRVDAVVTRVVDVLLAVPPLLSTLVLIAAFGNGTGVVILAVAAVFAPRTLRVLRGATQGVVSREYVLAARARGDTLSWIVGREILPNIAPTLFVELALRLTFAIMFIALLSFLGLGVQPPEPNWGIMVSENRGLLISAPVVVLTPALAIAALAVAVNLLADALTQYFSDAAAPRVML